MKEYQKSVSIYLFKDILFYVPVCRATSGFGVVDLSDAVSISIYSSHSEKGEVFHQTLQMAGKEVPDPSMDDKGLSKGIVLFLASLGLKTMSSFEGNALYMSITQWSDGSFKFNPSKYERGGFAGIGAAFEIPADSTPEEIGFAIGKALTLCIGKAPKVEKPPRVKKESPPPPRDPNALPALSCEVDDDWFNGGMREVNPQGPWHEDGVIYTFMQMFKNDEPALRAVLLICSIYEIVQTNSFFGSDWSVDHRKKRIYMAQTWNARNRSNENAARKLYRILTDEFFHGEDWSWRKTDELKAAASSVGGNVLLLAPEPMVLTKYANIAAETTATIEIQTEEGFKPLQSLREGAGVYSRFLAGEEVEIHTRYQIGWNLFLFRFGKGLGVTKIGNIPLRKLPPPTKAAMERVFQAIREK